MFNSTTETLQKSVKYAQKFPSGVFIVSFDNHFFFSVFIANFKQVNISWVKSFKNCFPLEDLKVTVFQKKTLLLVCFV